jgi:NhaP-type Na+/H+ or K+/H+ antiporter
VLAFTAYGCASSLQFSGVFASAAAGITLRAMRGFVLTAQAPEDIDRFWEVIAFVANAVVSSRNRIAAADSAAVP